MIPFGGFSYESMNRSTNTVFYFVEVFGADGVFKTTHSGLTCHMGLGGEPVAGDLEHS